MKKIISKETKEKTKATKEENNKKLYEVDGWIISQDSRQYILSKSSDNGSNRYFTTHMGVISYLLERHVLSNVRSSTDVLKYAEQVEKLINDFEKKIVKILTK